MAFGRWISRVRNSIEFVAAIFLALVAIVAFSGAVARYLLRGGLPDAYEIAQMLQGIAILWGIALATHDGRHITFDIVYDRMSARGRYVLRIVSAVICLIFLSIAFYKSLQRAMEAVYSGLTTTQLSMPVWPFWMLAVFGLAAAAIMAAIALWRYVSGTPAHDE